MTKKLIRVKAEDKVLGIYKAKLTDQKLYFSFIGADEKITKDGFKRKFQKAKFVACREFLCGIPRAAINNFEYTDHINKDNYDIDFDNFRLLIGSNGDEKKLKDAKKKIFSGKRALNILEEAAGWQQSVITTVKHEDYVDDNVFLLTGDGRWMTSPQMISLATLVLRLGYTQDLDTNSLKGLMKSFTGFAKEGGFSDYNYIGHCRKHIVTLMKNVNKVFHADKKVYYPAKDGDGWLGYGGIDTLMKSSTGIPSLTDSFKKHVLDKVK
jgi:hypothetical protein